MDIYFERMNDLLKSNKLPSRIKFMIQVCLIYIYFLTCMDSEHKKADACSHSFHHMWISRMLSIYNPRGGC
jgi:hypothetical protein